VITDDRGVITAQQMLASASLFRVTGVRPVLGRFYTEQEDRPGGPHVAVRGYALWQRAFGGARDVLGRSLHVAGDLYTVIGVAPAGFTGVALQQIDLILPITTTQFDASRVALTSRDYSWVRVVARLAPGATLARAQTEAKVVYARSNPGDTVQAWQIQVFGGPPAEVHPVMEQRREMAKTSIPVALWLTGVATAVLLIACANVAGLLIARSIPARRDAAIRAALGASRRRLIGELLLESGVLTLGGAIVAVVASRWADLVIRKLILTDLAPLPSSLDGRRLATALVVAIVTALIAGLWPALRAVRGDLAREMMLGGRLASRPCAHGRRALLVTQLALAMALVVGAGLFTTSLDKARALDLGMTLDHVLISDLNLSGAGYSVERARALVDPLIERLSAIPGVRSVALNTADMQPGWITYGYSVPGRDSLPRVRAAAERLHFSAVTPAFLSTLGTPIVRGRNFTTTDRSGRVIIVSEAFARVYWPGENPLGQCVKVGDGKSTCAEVIGVARDRHAAPGDTARLVETYVPLGSPAEPEELVRLFPVTSAAIRVDGDPALVAPVLQRTLQEMLPTAASIRVRPALSMFERPLRAWRLGAGVFTSFGAIALTLAVLGVYATIAYLVAQRRRELAIRVALGATGRHVSRVVFGETLLIAGLGAALGLVASIALARGVRAFLFGVSPLAISMHGGAAAVLILASLAATILPLRRALGVDPAVTLRDD
jgi:predicted permease